jgi:hypothetical protein
MIMAFSFSTVWLMVGRQYCLLVGDAILVHEIVQQLVSGSAAASSTIATTWLMQRMAKCIDRGLADSGATLAHEIGHQLVSGQQLRLQGHDHCVRL